MPEHALTPLTLPYQKLSGNDPGTVPAPGDLLGGESQAPPAASRGDATGPAQLTISSSDGNGGMFAGLDMFGGALASGPSPPPAAAAALTQPPAAEPSASLFGGLSLAGTRTIIKTPLLSAHMLASRNSLHRHTKLMGICLTADPASAVAPSSQARQPGNDLADLLADFGPSSQPAPVPAPAFGGLSSTAGLPGWSPTGTPAGNPLPQQPYPNGSAAHVPLFPPSTQQRPPQGSSPKGMGAAASSVGSMGLPMGDGGGRADPFDFDLTRQRQRGGQGMALQRGSSGAPSMGTARAMQSEPAGNSPTAAPHANGALGVHALPC